MAKTEFIIGKYYEVDYRKRRETFIYQGQDLGRNFTFVSKKALFKVAENQVETINAILKESV